MVYARTQTRSQPVTAQLKEWIAPVAGWIANRALAQPDAISGPGAAVLDNFFPKATVVSLRRGKALYATLEDETLNVSSLFTYNNGNNRKLFGANQNVIYDLSNIAFPAGDDITDYQGNLIGTQTGDWFGWTSTGDARVRDGLTGGDWITTQFATTGGVYLVGVNGEDQGFLYDGDVFLPFGIAIWQLNYSNLTSGFAIGETVTGGTSGATGVIAQNNFVGTAGTLYLKTLTGTFTNGENLTSESGAAKADGVELQITTNMTFGAAELTTADFDFVWVYMARLWFAQKDSLSAWYLDVDSVGGAATEFPLGGILTDGGSLMIGSPWSMGTSGNGGLSEQCVFISELGQVSIYQGASPDEAASWSKVGTYRIGTPLGRRAFIVGGGDIAICTSVGLVPLSKAISLDVTALNVATVSYNITDAWKDANDQRGREDWQAILWAEEKMSLIAPPDIIGNSAPVIFVANTETGAWCRFTGWQGYSFAVYDGRLFFGSSEGKVFQANVTGMDDGKSYTGVAIPLFDEMGSPGSLKVPRNARARIRASYKVRDSLRMKFDYDDLPGTAPDAVFVDDKNLWGTGIWGQSTWSLVTAPITQGNWTSVGGTGNSMAPCYQVTSGSLAPLDVQLIAIETTVTTATLLS